MENVGNWVCRCSGTSDPVTRNRDCACGKRPSHFVGAWKPADAGDGERGRKCNICKHFSLDRVSSGAKPMVINTFDAPVEQSNKPSMGPDDYQQSPGILPGDPVGPSASRGGYKPPALMKVASNSDVEKRLVMLRLAAFENSEQSGKKFKKIKNKWIEEVVNLPELKEVSEKDRKTLATTLFEDFVEFIYSKDNLHRTSDDLRALIGRIAAIESSRQTFMDIENLPPGFVNDFFSPTSSLFDNMLELVELYHDNSFRNYLRRVVDDAFSADMSGTTSDNPSKEDTEAPDGSLLSQNSMV